MTHSQRLSSPKLFLRGMHSELGISSESLDDLKHALSFAKERFETTERTAAKPDDREPYRGNTVSASEAYNANILLYSNLARIILVHVHANSTGGE